MDSKLLKEAIELAKYLEEWFGPFKEVFTFYAESPEIPHRMTDGTTVDEFLATHKDQPMKLVCTLCTEKTCPGGLHGTGVGMKFLEEFKDKYRKFSIATI